MERRKSKLMRSMAPDWALTSSIGCCSIEIRELNGEFVNLLEVMVELDDKSREIDK